MILNDNSFSNSCYIRLKLRHVLCMIFSKQDLLYGGQSALLVNRKGSRTFHGAMEKMGVVLIEE